MINDNRIIFLLLVYHHSEDLVDGYQINDSNVDWLWTWLLHCAYLWHLVSPSQNHCINILSRIFEFLFPARTKKPNMQVFLYKLSFSIEKHVILCFILDSRQIYSAPMVWNVWIIFQADEILFVLCSKCFCICFRYILNTCIHLYVHIHILRNMVHTMHLMYIDIEIQKMLMYSFIHRYVILLSMCFSING